MGAVFCWDEIIIYYLECFEKSPEGCVFCGRRHLSESPNYFYKNDEIKLTMMKLKNRIELYFSYRHCYYYMQKK